MIEFWVLIHMISLHRSSPPELFLGKFVLEICTKFTGEHSYRSEIWKKLQSDFIETTLRHGYSPVNLLHIIFSEHFFLRTPLEGCFWIYNVNQLVFHKRLYTQVKDLPHWVASWKYLLICWVLNLRSSYLFFFLSPLKCKGWNCSKKFQILIWYL